MLVKLFAGIEKTKMKYRLILVDDQSPDPGSTGISGSDTWQNMRERFCFEMKKYGIPPRP
ncbi:MAG: hypothetical protein ACLVAT_10765 [Lachnospiraceae bacterium]